MVVKTQKRTFQMFRLVALSVILFSINSVYALDCPSKMKPKEVALYMIRAELSGVQADGMSDHACLDQKKFPHLLVAHDSSSEMVKPIEGYVDDLKDVKVLNVQTVDPTVHSYNALFEVSYNDAKSGKKKTIKDSISFFLYTDAPNQSLYGCGGVLQHPEKIVLFKSCK